MPASRIFTKGAETTSVTDDLSATWLLANGWTEGLPQTYDLPRTTAVRLDDHDVRIHDLEDAINNIQGVNVLADPEFDSWTSPTQPGGWGTFWGTGTRSTFRETVAPYSGQNALGANLGASSLQWIGSQIFAVEAGASVTARVFAKANTVDKARMGFALFIAPAGGQPDHFGSGANNLGGPTQILGTDWVEYTASWTVPATGAYTQGRLYFSIDSPDPAATYVAYLDRAKAIVTPPEVPIADDSGWLVPSLTTPFANYGSTWETAAYRKRDGVVFLRGLVVPSAAAGGGSQIFQLPPGYKYGSDSHVLAATGVSPWTTLLNIKADGTVRLNQPIASGQWLSLANITFPADG